MHRTLFTPAMIETFRSCKKAYETAVNRLSNGSTTTKASVLCKKFILRALAEINRGKLTNVNQVQKYMGQNWPVDKLEEQLGKNDKVTRAFLFAYKTLIRYVTKPYRPDGAHVVAVALKVRARIAHVRVYVEDTLDLVLWYPGEGRLEIVDFQMQPLKPLDPAWPTSQILVKHYLAERLKTRWAFDKVTLTYFRAGVQEYQNTSITLEESMFRLHWDELVKTLEQMKETGESATGKCAMHGEGSCAQCSALIPQAHEVPDVVSEPTAVFKMSA